MLLIDVEGPDGAGKTTAVERLHQRLEEWTSNLNFRVTVKVVSEPGSGDPGVVGSLRRLLQGEVRAQADMQELLHIFMASRIYKHRELRKAEARLPPNYLMVVISDRSFHSSLVYQGLMQPNTIEFSRSGCEFVQYLLSKADIPTPARCWIALPQARELDARLTKRGAGREGFEGSLMLLDRAYNAYAGLPTYAPRWVRPSHLPGGETKFVSDFDEEEMLRDAQDLILRSHTSYAARQTVKPKQQ